MQLLHKLCLSLITQQSWSIDFVFFRGCLLQILQQKWHGIWTLNNMVSRQEEILSHDTLAASWWRHHDTKFSTCVETDKNHFLSPAGNRKKNVVSGKTSHATNKQMYSCQTSSTIKWTFKANTGGIFVAESGENKNEQISRSVYFPSLILWYSVAEK